MRYFVLIVVMVGGLTPMLGACDDNSSEREPTATVEEAASPANAPSPTETSSSLPTDTQPPPPTSTLPPPPTEEVCHPSYVGACLDPSASDYDCLRGKGDGPLYTGTVTVVGPDVFGLDADNDGIGCE